MALPSAGQRRRHAGGVGARWPLPASPRMASFPPWPSPPQLPTPHQPRSPLWSGACSSGVPDAWAERALTLHALGTPRPSAVHAPWEGAQGGVRTSQGWRVLCVCGGLDSNGERQPRGSGRCGLRSPRLRSDAMTAPSSCSLPGDAWPRRREGPGASPWARAWGSRGSGRDRPGPEPVSAWAEPALRCLVPKGQAGHPLCRQHGGDPRPTCPSRLASQTAPRRPPAVSKQSPRDPGPSLALLLHRPEASAGSMALFSSPWAEGGRLGQNEQRRGLGQGEPLRRRAAGCWRGCGCAARLCDESRSWGCSCAGGERTGPGAGHPTSGTSLAAVSVARVS